MFILFVLYGLYFFYLYLWAASYLNKEYSFGSPSSPKSMGHSPVTSVLVAIFWGFTIIAGTFWGFTTKPYGDYFSIQKLGSWSRSDMELFFLIVICIVIGLSYWIMFYLGEMRGVARMKQTALFITWEEGQRKKNKQAQVLIEKTS
jgi:hypothetical protein